MGHFRRSASALSSTTLLHVRVEGRDRCSKSAEDGGTTGTRACRATLFEPAAPTRAAALRFANTQQTQDFWLWRPGAQDA